MSGEGAFQVWKCPKCGKRYLPQELDAIPFVLDFKELSPEDVVKWEEEFRRIIADPHTHLPIIAFSDDQTVKLTLACGHNIIDLVPAPSPTAAEMLGTPL